MARMTPYQENWEAKQIGRWLRELASRLNFGSFTWDPPNVPAASTVDTVIDTTTAPLVDGVRVGMAVTASPPDAIDDGLAVTAWVGADNTLTIRLANVTAGAINPASGTWSYFAVLT